MFLWLKPISNAYWYMIPERLIFRLSNVLFDTYEVRWIMVFNSIFPLLVVLLPTLMPIGRVALLRDAPPLVTMLFSARILSHGRRSDKLLFLDLVRKQSIVALPMQFLKLHRFAIYLGSYTSLLSEPLLFIATM